MAPKGSAKKGTATRRRRERKNIERGAAHIQSTFNNLSLPSAIHRVMQYHGLQQVRWASEVQRSQLRSQLRLLLK